MESGFYFYFCFHIRRGQCSQYDDWITGWMVWGSNPGRNKRFSLLKNIQTGAGAQPASNSMNTAILSVGKSAGA
jgi:hypothetical protein